MSKKILLIKGSPRENGVTNRICNEIIKSLQGCDITVFDTYKESFKPCTACGYCCKYGTCVNRDLDGFYNDFENADIIIFLSPVYNGTFPAPLKALIDRFQVYFNSFYLNSKKQPISKQREAYFIAASGRTAKAEFDYMTKQLKCAFSILNINLKGKAICENTDRDFNLSDYLKDIKRSLTNEKDK